ncbi:CBL-interacting protein kinase 2 [Citrus sinensis]|uniref:CBL-interacting protein kinase 2 n=1 Tax=Citrus sinensis TaxID=2711 RepID=A0ACB8JWE3_CITSI|nr:CBL-interacting protein kinase 2 [Citrus sinensis]
MENKGSILMQRYELGRLLGQGTFAKVHYARNLKTGMSVAIKIIDKEKVLKVGMIDQIKREISVMRLVRHPNVVELYEVMASKTKIYFVMEYVKGGELFGKVAKGKLKEDAARKYFQQLISAVDYCHSRGVCHRDLKPENLLLDEHGNLKVSDFGLSALAESKHQDGLLHTTCGTPAYVAPEVINRRGYDGSKIGKAEFKFPNWFAPEVRRLLSKILDPNPNTRISMTKIMENSWFRKGLVKPSISETEEKEWAPVDADAVFSPSGSTSTVAESKNELAKPCNLNAFDIISFSAGFDLSGLFEEREKRKEVRFTSNKPVSTIISKLEGIAKLLRLKVKKKDGGLLKIEGSKEGRKGVLGMDAEIFEITPFFHLVEVKKSSGDTLEYQKVMNQEIRPALKDIVWTWQGEQRQQCQEQVAPLPEQQELPPCDAHPLPIAPPQDS